MRRIALGLVALLFVTGACGRGEPVAQRDEPTTTTTAPYDGRLHVAFKSYGYVDGGNALGNWKMDPAPAGTTSALTKEAMLAKWEASDFGRGWKREGKQARVYFGLFDGNEPNPNAPDGRLTGVHPITGVPAWLVIVDDILVMPSGPAGLAGESRPPRTAVRSHAVTAYRDDPSAVNPISGLEESGGDAPLVY